MENKKLTGYLKDLVAISNFFGSNPDYIIAGGGNTSFKDEDTLYVKASGTNLADITADEFVLLDRKKMEDVLSAKYSSNPTKREEEVKKNLFKCNLDPESGIRPSVEASLHGLINYKYVVHTHPTFLNSILCSKTAEKEIKKLFSKDSIFVKYTDPGLLLSKAVKKQIEIYKKNNGSEPKMIFLENHGVFVSSDTIDGINKIYKAIERKVSSKIKNKKKIKNLPISQSITEILPALRMLLADNNNAKILKIKNDTLIESFLESSATAKKVSLPLVPDNILYCNAKPLYLQTKKSVDEFLKYAKAEIKKFESKNGYKPKVLLAKGLGLVTAGDSNLSATIVRDVFYDLMKISYNSNNFGGPKFLSPKEISFIENWEAEKYKMKVNAKHPGRVENKIAIVTGGAQGFGGGIVAELVKEGANVVIADLNEKLGKSYADELNENLKSNNVVFVKTDVSNEESISNLIYECVANFGGLDVFVSNAGVLRAGGLDEMDLKTFEFMTKVNYSAYFLCAQGASKVLKVQNKYNPNYYTDIIQINSKSGLKGSNKNFAYAGGKFGGIGLTQSFAMELMPSNVKVNSICPGNFFDGPLWSDPKNGLFVQYLNAKKVPGAKTIEDVKKFYEAQVPANRGCTVIDVMRALYYVIEQEYETGQAIPVTGGQNMLK